MAEIIKANRYIANYGTTKVSVDAPSLVEAAKYILAVKGGVEPNAIILQEVGIDVVKPMSDVNFQVIVEEINGETPGKVYPPVGAVAVGTVVYFTAVEKEGYILEAWTDTGGHVLGTDQVLTYTVTRDQVIVAKFKKKMPSSITNQIGPGMVTP